MTGNIIETVTSKTVYSNKWMRVREDKVVFPNGAAGIYGVVEKPEFVVIIPIDNNRKIHLVQQYRYPVEGRYWELPMGASEVNPNEDPEILGLAELREETGLRAGKMMHVGHLFQAPGFTVHGFNIYIATNLKYGNAERENSESDMITKSFTLNEIKMLIFDGEMKDATSIAALGLITMSSALNGLLE